MAALDKLFSASITFREIPTDKLGELGRSVMELLGIAPYFPVPLFVLHTCNRVEVYAWDVPQTAVELVLAHYRDYADRVVIRRGREAALHLLEVAAGLDSMLIGETDILGQLEEAYDSQVKAHITREPLRTVVERAIRFGKTVRTRTNISRGPRGLGSLAIIYIKERFGDLQNLSIGVIGAGAVGSGLVKELRDGGAGRIYILNRTLDRAEEVAKKYGAIAMPLNGESVAECLKTCDVVFTTALSFEPIITEIPPGSKVKVVVDLGVPGNVPKGLPVDVVKLEDLEDIAARYNKERASEIEKARALALEELDKVERAVAKRIAEMELSEYMQFVEAAAREEASRAGSDSLTAARSSAKRAVLPLVEALKELAGRGKVEEVLEIINEARRRVKSPATERTSAP
ncbi:MAG: NAD(P)-binding domain-containing protein [Thermoproteus sp.]